VDNESAIQSALLMPYTGVKKLQG